jgi:hypothetical protein
VIDFNKPADLSCARTADPFSNPLSVPDLEYCLLMTGFPNFVSEKESRLWIMMVQVKENYQQRGYRKVWDTFLSNYGKG